MADPFVRSHVNNLPLFNRLPPEQLEIMADAFEAFQLQPNQVIYQQGYPAQGLYVFVNGLGYLNRTTADGTQQFVGEVRGGQYVGEAALFKALTETTTLYVAQPAIILFLSRARLEQVLAQVPEIRANINSRYAPPPQLMAAATSADPETFRPRFQGQRPGEKILVFERRRHWWALAQHLILPVLLGIAMIVLGLFVGGSGLSWLIFFAAVVITGIWMGYLYYEWSDDYIIVTDQRVIREENTLFGFNESISEIPFSSIQEVSYSIPAADPFAQLFQYGTLIVRTAGTSGNLQLPYIPNPAKLQQLVFNYRQNYQNSLKQQNREAIRGEIDRFLQGDKGTVEAQATSSQPPVSVHRNTVLSTRYINANGELVYRKHLSIWVTHMTMPLLVLFAGFMLIVLSLLSITIEGLGGLQIIVGFFVMLLGGIWAYWADWDWRKDMYIIGDKSLRLIHKRPLWLQDTSDQILLTQIDNVISDRSGIMNTLMDRGDVRIFLVGDDKKNAKVFQSVHRPAQVQDEISNRRAHVLEITKREETQSQHRTITEYLDIYHERLNTMNRAAAAQPPYQDPAPPNTPAPDNTRPPRVPRVRSE